jgi:hypothetical protein
MRYEKIKNKAPWEKVILGEGEVITGYKAMNNDWTCQGHKYKTGETYHNEEPIVPCKNGYHFCLNVVDCFAFYDPTDCVIVKVEAWGTIIKDVTKLCAEYIRIGEEFEPGSIDDLYAHGHQNSGHQNSGDQNSGNWNSGDQNSGNFCSCNNSSGVFMSRRISYEAFNKTLSKEEYDKLIRSRGYEICKDFHLVRFRVRTRKGKYGDFRYLDYKTSWRVFWNNLSFKDRCAVRAMPYFDAKVFYEITSIKLGWET